MKLIIPKANQLVVLVVNLLVLELWGFASIGKIHSGVPNWFIELFKNTHFEMIPGLSASFWMIVAAEFTAFFLALISLLRMEFLKDRLPFLRAALLMGVVNFLMLEFGVLVASDMKGQERLFNYFVLSLVIYLFLDRYELGIKTRKD